MGTLTGLGRLVRFILRRDRVRLSVWVLAITAITVASAGGLPEIYPDQRAIDTYVALFGNNPSLVAFAGPGYGFDDPNLGIVLVNETQINGMIALALMSIFLVNRHTRAEEESERAELLRSSVVGRHAPAAAAATVIGGANLLVGALCAAGFIGLDYQTSGSLALAGSMALAGLMFAGVAAVAAQVTSSGRATLGLASGALAVAFVIRAIGDVADNGLSWLSPLGWAQGVRAFADERWWTLGLCLAVFAGLMVAALWLSTRRDLGSGLLPQRPGRPHASEWMVRPLGLAFRLQRGALIGWSLALFMMGFLYGSIAKDIDQMLEQNEAMAEMFAQIGGNLTDSFFAAGMAQLGLMAGGFAIAAALRLSTEETSGRAEPILSASIGRTRWASSHIAMAFLGSILVIACAGLGTGISYAAITQDAGAIPRLLGAALVTVPAILVLAGTAVAMFGLLPGHAKWAWGVLAIVVVLGMLGQLLQLPEWTRWISPYEHLPAVPAEDLNVVPLLGLSAIAAGLTAAGLWSFRGRDLRTE